MNPNSYTLDSIMELHKLTSDSLTIAIRAAKKPEIFKAKELFADIGFPDVGDEETERQIQSSRKESQDLYVLLLWAVFERFIIDHAQTKLIHFIASCCPEAPKSARTATKNAIEYCNIDTLLDVFKAFVDPKLIGNAKQIKDYRDWVAHRNPRKLPDANTTPKSAHAVLSNIIRAITALESPN
ncbi:MAG: hypothetical protein ACLQO6_03550 [Desulfomonilaceae bacterium]